MLNILLSKNIDATKTCMSGKLFIIDFVIFRPSLTLRIYRYVNNYLYMRDKMWIF